MNAPINYILEVCAASGILYLGYLLLRNKVPASINRIILLGIVLIPLILPHLEIKTGSPSMSSTQITEIFSPELSRSDVKPLPSSTTLQASESSNSDPRPSNFDWLTSVFIAYSAISFLLLSKLLLSIFSILSLKNKGRFEERNPNYWLVQTDRFIGASFFNLIFINENYKESEKLTHILQHEKIHKEKWHSLDILLSEIYCAVFWFNPIVWFLKKEIKKNHEYEIDEILARELGHVNYSHLLVSFSANTSRSTPLNLFSYSRISKRINSLLHKRKKKSNLFLGTPFLALAIWLISCETDVTDISLLEAEAALKDVKKITTTYISHQSDTQHKSGNIIAEAHFLPDGSLDRVVQHMTYPYDYKDPFEISFMTSPKATGVPYIMDGLDVGPIEKNLLYGNDWPRIYASKAETNHPRFRSSELFKYSTEIEYADEELPARITVKEQFTKNSNLSYYDANGKKVGSRSRHSYLETFEYAGDKVVSYSYGANHSAGEMDESDLNEQKFTYDNNNLTDVKLKEWNHKHYYNHDLLVRSEYYKGDKLYTYREYFYNGSGLKVRTEMFNLYGDPEYTIKYDYDFYQ